MKRLLKAAQKDDSGMLAGMFGLHAQFTLSDKTLDLCQNIVRKALVTISMWLKVLKIYMTAYINMKRESLTV